MRIIHTADWHLGHSLNGWGREDEHRVFFRRLADVIEAERADILLVAGDIFDSSNPSGEVQRLLYEALADFRRRRPNLVTVISGGNHDPAQRLEAPMPVLRALGVHVVATVQRREGRIDVARHLVPVNGPDGTPALYILAIPFLRASDLGGHGAFEDGVSGAARRFYAEITEQAAEIAGDLPIIATSHLHCAGGLESEGAERRILIGGAHALPPAVFPERLAYVALGHLHGQQTLKGGRVRYSGACFPLSASEIRHDHGVTLIEIDKGEAVHRHVSIPRPAEVLRIPASGTAALADLPAALDAAAPDEEMPMGLRPIVYLELAPTDAASILMTDAARLVAERGLRLGGARVHRASAPDAPEAPPVASLSETDPETLFAAAFEATNGIAPEPRHLDAFRDILAGE
ncbi:exonuclease subunit SbcD [Roseovarius aquimarinus]|uniref:Nuclease SbcCD subunit D n=1 Tax=Roseovarius aquimarinus TaxID=1229156 RepID=A0ABW7I5Y3_9RHOB